jgi:hypothetical protein
MGGIQTLDVTIPATDGRELRFASHLLDQLGFTMPAQPPPEIRNHKPVVETF